MCPSYSKVIIASFLSLLVIIHGVTTFPTEAIVPIQAESSIPVPTESIVPAPTESTVLVQPQNIVPVTTEQRAESNRLSQTAESPDTATAKFGNTTIIFGHQHVLFSAPTRAPHRIPVTMGPGDLVENLVAPANQSPRQSKGNEETPRRIDYTSSEEKELFEEEYEVVEDEKRRHELCPGTARGRQQLLFDQSATKCGKVGEKGHCGPNMVFRYDPYVDNSTLYGYCECDFGQSRTPLVYHPELKACFFIYQKAYCDTKEWLIFNTKGEAICEKRICPKSSSRRSKLLTELVEVPINGTGPCVPLNQPSKHCPHPEDTVHFHPDELYPRCGLQRLAPAPRIISPIRQIRCRPGSYVNIIGKCQPAWDW